RRHTICSRDWSSDVCSSDLGIMASVLLLASAPPLVFAIGDELAPLVTLEGTIGWFTWQAVLALGAAAWLGIAVAPLRGARDESRSAQRRVGKESMGGRSQDV